MTMQMWWQASQVLSIMLYKQHIPWLNLCLPDVVLICLLGQVLTHQDSNYAVNITQIVRH